MEHMLDKDVERVLFSEEELHRRVAEIAAEIDRDYAGREPLLVSVLRGSFVFMADLVRQIHLPCTVDFMAVSSYGAGTASSGQVRIIKDLSEHIEGRDVIVVEDNSGQRQHPELSAPAPPGPQPRLRAAVHPAG